MGNHKERIVKGIADYKCWVCQEAIPKGEKHKYILWRSRLRDWECGEYYWSTWESIREHLHDCVTPEECQKGNHFKSQLTRF